MHNFIPSLVIAQVFLQFCIPVCAQSPFHSETAIKYDLLTHKTDKPIPFDRSFTLVIEKLLSKNVVEVNAYEARYHKGKRELVENSFTDCSRIAVTIPVRDMPLKWNIYSDTLQIFFPPLKPSVDFDINIAYDLSKGCLPTLMKVNAKLADGTAASVIAADNLFTQVSACALDRVIGRTNFGITTFAAYQIFFKDSLSASYTNLGNAASFVTNGSLSKDEVQAIDMTTTLEVLDFKDGSYLLECLLQNNFPAIQAGTLDISKVFQKGAITTLYDGYNRAINLEANLKFIDSVFRRLDRVISKGLNSKGVNGTVITLTTVRTKIETIRTNMRDNLDKVNAQMEIINTAIKGDTRIRQGIYLAANTLSSDLKTAGGSILFLDAGITNIVAEGVNGKAVYLPKFHYGVSIYFRPIDKNTRRSRFPNKFIPPAFNGCQTVAGQPEYGPDYGIVTKRNILQHLSLNIGVTFGSMVNKDFDNFYNNTSLLIGPAYRFARAFKISSGIALLRRSSKNPAISEKKTIPAGYISLSVDIDLLQGIKDITSILFK